MQVRMGCIVKHADGGWVMDPLHHRTDVRVHLIVRPVNNTRDGGQQPHGHTGTPRVVATPLPYAAGDRDYTATDPHPTTAVG